MRVAICVDSSAGERSHTTADETQDQINGQEGGCKKIQRSQEESRDQEESGREEKSVG